MGEGGRCLSFWGPEGRGGEGRGGEGRGGERWTREKVRGATVHKAESTWRHFALSSLISRGVRQNMLMYTQFKALQCINYVKLFVTVIFCGNALILACSAEPNTTLVGCKISCKCQDSKHLLTQQSSLEKYNLPSLSKWTLQLKSLEWLKRTRLSRYLMIWLLPHPPPLPLSRQQVVSLSQTSLLSPAELSDNKSGVRGWGRSKVLRWRESLVLYKAFSTLCHYFSSGGAYSMGWAS